MSRQVLIASYQPDVNGPTYGRVSDPVDFMNSQGYAHEHVERITKDFLMTGGAAQPATSGFDYSIGAGLSLSIQDGEVAGTDGLLHDLFDAAPVTVNFSAAHPSLPRLDLVVAKIEPNTDALPLFKPYTRLRTQAELESGAPPYTPTQFNNATERHNRVTLLVKTGTAAANPAAPAAGANEVPLYQVLIGAGATTLVAGNVTDVRNKIRTLPGAWAQIDAINNQLSPANLHETIDDRVAVLVADSTYLNKSYNDAGNLLTIDADLIAFDARYVNTNGDNMTGQLTVDPPALVTMQEAFKVGSGASQNQNKLFRIQSVDTHIDPGEAAGARAGLRLVFYGDFFGNNGECRLDWFTGESGTRGLWRMGNGMTFFADSTVTNGNGQAFVFRSVNQAVFGQRNDIIAAQNAAGANVWFVTQSGDMTCTGTLSKASGTFLIDHPLDPNNKNLRHGFIEAPRYELIYRGTLQLGADGKGMVNVDVASNMTAGTFAALTQKAEVLLYNKSSARRVFPTTPANVDTGVFQIECESPFADEILWLVIAERDDAYVHNTPECDAQGELVVEFAKPIPPAELLANLSPISM
ncbi:MAG: hypothetical protein ACRD9R_21405, partial [Pyrinomonadaceae bacterium]